MQIFAPMMEHQISANNRNKDLCGRPFQILGIDVLIDENLKAWALEVNGSPSLNIFFEKEEYDAKLGKVSVVLDETDVCPVDWYIKSRIVRDAVELARHDSA